MAGQSVGTQVWTIPNVLSMLRLLLVPVFLVLVIQGQYVAALIVLVVASLSDLLDGYIARRFDQVTRLGQLLDPQRLMELGIDAGNGPGHLVALRVHGGDLAQPRARFAGQQPVMDFAPDQRCQRGNVPGLVQQGEQPDCLGPVPSGFGLSYGKQRLDILVAKNARERPARARTRQGR